MTYDPTLADIVSRLRLAVGDTDTAALVPDATYTGAVRLTRTHVQAVTLAAGGAVTWDALPSDGSCVWLSDLTAAPGVTADTPYYVRDGDAGSLTSNLAATPTGDALTLTADARALAGVVDEPAAIREIARALSILYAQQPSNVTLPNGLRVQWAERVQTWQAIARGEGGGGRARRASGQRWRRGPAIDYTTGDGDANPAAR